MANIRFTCEEKKHTSCQQPRTEAVLKNEKGDPQFKVLICQACWGVVASEKIEVEKKKGTSRKTTSKTETKKFEEPANAPEATKEEATNTAPAPEPSNQEKPDLKTVILQLEKDNKSAVEKLTELKSLFGYSNAEAAKVLKERQDELRESAVVAQPQAEEKKPEPVAEAKPEELPNPLPAKEAEEAKNSPIQPKKIQSIPLTEKAYEIHAFKLVPETKSYHFKLHTDEGVEFEFDITPDPIKYATVEKNPTVFDGRSLIFKYDKIDDGGCPVDPTMAGLK